MPTTFFAAVYSAVSGLLLRAVTAGGCPRGRSPPTPVGAGRWPDTDAGVPVALLCRYVALCGSIAPYLPVAGACVIARAHPGAAECHPCRHRQQAHARAAELSRRPSHPDVPEAIPRHRDRSDTTTPRSTTAPDSACCGSTLAATRRPRSTSSTTYCSAGHLQIDVIQTDNGAEFQTGFHWYVLDTGIAHTSIKLASPHLNAKGRALAPHRHRVFNDRIREWGDYYNHHRPHGALDGQTPYERLNRRPRPRGNRLRRMHS